MALEYFADGNLRGANDPWAQKERQEVGIKKNQESGKTLRSLNDTAQSLLLACRQCLHLHDSSQSVLH